MVFLNIINTLARIYNKFLMALISIIITVILIDLGFYPENLSYTTGTGLILVILWSFLALISLIYSLNGFLLNFSFNREVKKMEELGKPIKGVRGFSELVDGLASARNMSLLISLAAIASFATFLTIPEFQAADLNEKTFSSLALTMVFVSVSIVFLIELPKETALDPGGLTGFYEPDSFPIVLDNTLSDVVLTYLDPVTFMEIDEYLASLLKMLEPEFESDENDITRVERAFEKILLLAYLSNNMPSIVTKDVIRREIEELIGVEDFEEFYRGSLTGLTWKELQKITKKVEEQAPEVFRLVDRLTVNLTDNYHKFINKDLYFTIAAETKQGSIKESSGAIVFFLNNTEKDNRIMKVIFDSDINSIHPNTQTIKIGLDKQTDPYPTDPPKFIAEGDDVLTILSTIFQVGDAVWFRFKPSGFGYKLIKIHAEEVGTGNIMGLSLEMKFTKSISWYVKTYAPRLSALSGVAMPFLQNIFFNV